MLDLEWMIMGLVWVVNSFLEYKDTINGSVYGIEVDGVAKEHIERRHLTVDISEAWKSVFNGIY